MVELIKSKDLIKLAGARHIENQKQALVALREEFNTRAVAKTKRCIDRHLRFYNYRSTYDFGLDAESMKVFLAELTLAGFRYKFEYDHNSRPRWSWIPNKWSRFWPLGTRATPNKLVCLYITW